MMIKAFLCDITLLLTTPPALYQPLIADIHREKRAFILLTAPDDSPEMVYEALSAVPALADEALFTFMTHNENSHFLRQDPSFFAEVLARVGIEPHEALIITPLDADVQAGYAIGINSFHVTTESPIVSACHGTFEQLMQLMTTNPQWENCFKPIPLASMMIVPQLRGNIGAIQGLLSHIKAEFWHQHPDPHEWSPYQIICHLLESEETIQRPRLEKILSQDNPFLSESVTPPTPNCHMSEEKLTQAFYLSRQKTIAWLESCPMEVWQRLARHSIFGPTSFLEMAHFTAQHDRLHINQLCQTLQKCR